VGKWHHLKIKKKLSPREIRRLVKSGKIRRFADELDKGHEIFATKIGISKTNYATIDLLLRVFDTPNMFEALEILSLEAT